LGSQILFVPGKDAKYSYEIIISNKTIFLEFKTYLYQTVEFVEFNWKSCYEYLNNCLIQWFFRSLMKLSESKLWNLSKYWQIVALMNK